MNYSTNVKLAVLKSLKELGGSSGASRIRQQLQAHGLDLQPRTIRFYLLQTDREGLTRTVSRRAGREVTERGRQEVEQANIMERVRFVAARIDLLVYQMTYDLQTATGTIVSNLALIPRDYLLRAVEDMRPVLARHFGMGNKLAIIPEGETYGSITVPKRWVGVATICSVTANGILLKQGIPVVSRFGGLMEIREGKPVRLVALIEYSGTTLDPLEAFIRARMTQVRECGRTGTGVIGVSFREIPAAAVAQVRQIKKEMEKQGLDGILAVGTPNQPLFDIPVGEGRAGLIINGGLNPLAALWEARAAVEFRSLAEVENIERFMHYEIVRNQLHG